MKRQSILASLLAVIASWSLLSGTAHAQTPATVGQWTQGPLWDITPINMLVVPSGKVMFYPGYTIYGDDARLWDPATNTLTSLAKAGYDLFCTGHSFLTDGTILFSGGTVTNTQNDGLPYASIYNPVTNVWRSAPNMNAGRWYPTSTTTGTGDVLVMTGWIDNTQGLNALPQVWQPSLGTWRSLTNALLQIAYYSWVYWAPSGKALVVGPDQTTRYLDISGTGAWTSTGAFNYPNTRGYGSSVLYSSSKILIAGGSDPPTNTAEIFDLNSGTWQYTNSMAFPRRQFNLVLLPDDNVLAVGGSSGPGFNDETSPVYASEMWNTTTKTWTTMASQTVGRFYHSVAVLLPDGRVLSGGGTNAYQTEIYSPPYLFKGARPTITSAPSTVPYSALFFVGTPDATTIANVRLMRLPAVTHAFDQNQRILPVSFTQTTGGLNLTAPSDRNLAPVGHYMLFILNGNGVPSVAKVIQLGVSPTAPAAPTGLGATAASSSTIYLSWTDQSTDEDSFKIERAVGAGAFSQVGTVSANITTYTDSGLTASTSYSYRVRASNTAGDSAYSNTATATTTAANVSGTFNMSYVFPDSGFAYWSTQSFGATPDTQACSTCSNLRVFENGVELGPAHTAWATIETVGRGAFEYYSDGTQAELLFSTSDNTDPRYNGRTYTYQVGSSSLTPPTAPTSLAATATSSTGISLTWTDQSNNEDGFKIERALGAGSFAQIATVGRNSATYADSGLTASTSYSYQVRAYNTAGNSAYSNTATATTQASAPTAPAAPTGLGATAASSSTINLNWTDQATNEDGFKIERALGAGSFAQIATVGVNSTTYADSGLTASTSYSYQVRAYNTAGNSAYSNTATATTQASAPTAPAAPTGLGATAASSSTINLNWTDQATNEDGFKIERATSGGTFSQIATVGRNSTTYSDTGLAAKTSYSYRVRAYNSIGDSAYSNTANGRTKPK